MMYYIFFGFLYLVSLLPFFILYGIADVAFFVLYYVVGYRKEVVMTNLRYAFPEKKLQELQGIRRRFFRNFIDNWIETIKLLSITKKGLNKRITGNYEVLGKLYRSGHSAQANMGHFFNWEIMTLHAGIHQPYPFLTVYLPQSSAVIDRLLKHIRGRWGNPLIPSTDMGRSMIPWRKKQYLIALGADQNQSNPLAGYWLNFLNRPAVFPKGPERFARSQNLAVVMMTTTKPKRGHYHYEYFLLDEEPKMIPDGDLMRKYVRHLEENIREHPDLYLWSHKRWKHDWKDDYRELWVDNAQIPSSPKK